jgi:hypothetical protein
MSFVVAGRLRVVFQLAVELAPERLLPAVEGLWRRPPRLRRTSATNDSPRGFVWSSSLTRPRAWREVPSLPAMTARSGRPATTSPTGPNETSASTSSPPPAWASFGSFASSSHAAGSHPTLSCLAHRSTPRAACSRPAGRSPRVRPPQASPTRQPSPPRRRSRRLTSGAYQQLVGAAHGRVSSVRVSRAYRARRSGSRSAPG